MPNIRSPEAAQWRRLYKRARWQRIRRSVLAEHPLCQCCEAQGRVVPATDVHHNPPHEGNIERFWGGPFEALCKPCHDGPVGQAERSGRAYDTAIGPGGWPTDPAHPANRGAPLHLWSPPTRRVDAPHPDWLLPSRIPVHLVCGPPAGGKTTFVAQHADAADLVLDLDLIVSRLSGAPLGHRWNPARWLTPALTERNKALASLARSNSWPQAWLIVDEPGAEARLWWRTTLGAGTSTYLLATPLPVCLARIDADPTRRRQQRAAATQWWQQYQPLEGDVVITLPTDTD